ncbi:MAG TPA: IPT/TIG domain-containing protein [Gemmatimonadales bacterium]
MSYRTLCGVSLALVTGWLLACGKDSTSPQGTPPTLQGVSPATGTVGTELTLTGTDFRSGASVLLDNSPADSVQVASATTAYALVPAGVAVGHAYAITVRNSDGTSAKLNGVFTPVAPVLLYVNGATKPSANAGSTVIVEGQAFGDRQGTGQVLFSNGAGGTIAATIASPADWTNTFIVTTVPAGAASGDVVVKTGTGTSNALSFTLTTNATFSPSAIGWTATTALPVGLSGHSAAFAVVGGASPTNLVYVTGGADSTYAPRNDVYYATIGTNGQLSAWTTTAALPASVAFHASVVATRANSRIKAPGYIYVLGGATNAAGAPTSTIYRGTLDSLSGAVTGWTTLATGLPAATHSFGAVIFRGDVYIAGGSATGNAPVASVYRARIDSTGALGAWTTEPSLPFGRSYHGFGQFGGYLYAFGGDSAAVTPNDSGYTNNATKLNQIAYARINLRTGDLAGSSWTVNGSGMTKVASKHTAVVAGGTVLVTGGLYSAANTGSTEETYAQINSDGTVGSFNGATGVHTILSAGGKNLFNHAALGYVDANGVAHVLVLGGDDVNAPGKKRAEVWFY